MSFCFFCSLLLVGWSVAVSLDTGAIRNKRQEECDTVGIAQRCSQNITDIDAGSQLLNLTEYRIRLNKQAAIRCTEPCFTALQNYYVCAGEADRLRELNQFSCLEYNDVYCAPIVFVESQNGSFLSNEPCGDFTFTVCEQECREAMQNNVGVLGCCGVEIVNGGFFFPPDAAELCGVDLGGCSGSASSTASIFVSLVVVVMVTIGLIQ